MRLRRTVPWVVVVVLVLAFAAVGGRGGAGGPALDPTSTSPDGAKALAELLTGLGVNVDQTPMPPAPGSPAGRALLLQDGLDAAGHRQLLDWVRAGGTLVAADPHLAAAFAAPARRPAAGGIVTAASTLAAGCASPAVAGVAAIDPAGGLGLRLPATATGCFPVPDGGDFMVISPFGRGSLVLLGGPALWTNARLGHLDNSILAANLLAPSSGASLQWILGPMAGSGHKSLWQLVPTRVKEGLVQLMVAVGLLCLWRGRRLGRPVVESQPVELAGSELVVAVGNLLQQGGRIDDAAGILRAGLARSLGDQLGVGSASSPDTLATVVSARTGLDRQSVLATLAGPPPPDEAALVGLARSADSIRQEMADVP